MPKRFSNRLLTSLRDSQMLRIRSGAEHRFLGIWVVVVRGRVFVRPWNDKPTGWRGAFLEEPRGAIVAGGMTREIPVRAKPARDERVNDAVDAAYAEKYGSKGNRKWVRGLQTARRRKTTMELVPR